MGEGVLYCANDPCDCEAVYMVVETLTPLCRTCAEAYHWGQAGPDKHLALICGRWDSDGGSVGEEVERTL